MNCGSADLSDYNGTMIDSPINILDTDDEIVEKSGGQVITLFIDQTCFINIKNSPNID